MAKLTLTFSECEHSGDLENYINDLVNSGAKIINSSVNSEAEIGTVSIEVEDKQAFLEGFKRTDSYDFCNNC